jgi:hypothetical protein
MKNFKEYLAESERTYNYKIKIVEVDNLSNIVTWLMEEYGDRPPTQPED